MDSEEIYDNILELPAGWRREPLGDVIPVIRGASPRPKGDPRYFGGDIPWIMISDITREKGKFLSKTKDHVTEAGAQKSRLLKAGTLILSNSGTVCVPKILAVDGCIHDGFVAFPELPENFEPLFLYYYFDLIRPNIINANRQGITQVNLNTTIVKGIRLPIAPLGQQKRIVAEIEKQFSRLDEAVANLKRVKANLKRYKAAVLKAAVEGKLTEEWRKQHPDVEPADKLLERILSERREKWQGRGKYKEPVVPDTTDLPELPEGWVWATLESISEALGGYAFKSKEFTSSGAQIVKMANIKMGKLDLSQRPSFIQNIPEDVLNRYRLLEGDILVTLTGTRKKRDYGYIVRIKNPETTLLLNQRIARLRPINANLSLFLTLALQSEIYRDRFFEHETGNVGQGNVGIRAVTLETIPLPPIEEQQEIVDLFEGLNSVADQILSSINIDIKRAARLRQSILKKAFSGKLIFNAGTATPQVTPQVKKSKAEK